MPNRADVYAIARLSAGLPLDGEVESTSEMFRPVVVDLAATELERRQTTLDWLLRIHPRRAEIFKAINDARPFEPMPAEPARRAAHLGDLAQANDSSRFLWNRHLVRRHANLLVSNPKVGKTYFSMDLSRRLYHGLPWPGGQPPTLPAGTKTLWICGDRHHDELLELAPRFRLPVEALMFNARPDDPYGGTNLDDPATIELLRENVEIERPALVIIDTLWRCTQRKLHVESEVNALMNPLITIAKDLDTTLLCLMHLSKDGETIGRRLEGVCRGILKMTFPDPEQPARRRIDITGNFQQPLPLGMTLLDGECDYDHEPPTEPAKGAPGRNPRQSEAAKSFIREELSAHNDQTWGSLVTRWETQRDGNYKTFERAVKSMRDGGELCSDGGKGTGRQMVLHLNGQD
jgi:hypothetical protein